MGLENNIIKKLQKEQNKLIRKKSLIIIKLQKMKQDSNVISSKINDINIKINKMQKQKDQDEVVLMAIGSNAMETKDYEGQERILFTGVVPLKIIAVNPTKKKLEEIYGREIEKEPEYISADENGVKKVRLDFIAKTVPNEKLGIDIEEIVKVTYFLEDKPKISSNGKLQVINVYGETQWATKDELKANKLADNLSFYPTKGMRPAYTGEEDLTNFVRTLLEIPKRQAWNTSIGGFADIKDISLAEGILDNVKKYFDGDISEILSAVSSFPNNKVKLPAGVKTTEDNKQYQSFATKCPIRNSVNKYDYHQKKVKETVDAGGYQNIDFGPDDFKFRLYRNVPESFNNTNTDPFAAPLQNNGDVSGPVEKSWFEN